MQVAAHLHVSRGEARAGAHCRQQLGWEGLQAAAGSSNGSNAGGCLCSNLCVICRRGRGRCWGVGPAVGWWGHCGWGASLRSSRLHCCCCFCRCCCAGSRSPVGVLRLECVRGQRAVACCGLCCADTAAGSSRLCAGSHCWLDVGAVADCVVLGCCCSNASSSLLLCCLGAAGVCWWRAADLRLLLLLHQGVHCCCRWCQGTVCCCGCWCLWLLPASCSLCRLVCLNQGLLLALSAVAAAASLAAL